MAEVTRIQAFYDHATFTLTYLVSKGSDALIIDPVLDYEPGASRADTTQLERLAQAIKSEGLRLHAVFETHAHADHLSGGQWLKARFGVPVVIGERIREVQAVFKGLFELDGLATDGSQFDRLIHDGETVAFGGLEVEALATPGHTPACVSYRIEDAVFTGDALFMHDYGTGRCDFPRGSASDLYESVQRLYALPDATRVFVGHDYRPGGREVQWETTIEKSKRLNPQLSANTAKDDFVAFREQRDAQLAAPRLLYPSVQINVDAGRLPAAKDGKRFLKLPLHVAGDAT
ncbi:MAG: MBL fold metallo-hydrolase [Myxococcota bacterium]